MLIGGTVRCAYRRSASLRRLPWLLKPTDEHWLYKPSIPTSISPVELTVLKDVEYNAVVLWLLLLEPLIFILLARCICLLNCANLQISVIHTYFQYESSGAKHCRL
jgi:hypothetical protein